MKDTDRALSLAVGVAERDKDINRDLNLAMTRFGRRGQLMV